MLPDGLRDNSMNITLYSLVIMEWHLEKGLSLERLKSLLDVRNAGGISKAAPGAVGRQNMIGRQLRDLEVYFGVKLIEKHGRQIFLTDEGRSLAETASQIATLIGDYRAKAKGNRRDFHLAAGGSLYDELLARRVGRLKQEKLVLHLEEIKQPKIFSTLKEGRIDAAISWAEPGKVYGLSSLTVGTMNYALYGHRKLLSGRHAPESIWELPSVIVAFRDLSTELEERRRTDEIVYVDENVTAFNVVSSGEYVGVLPCLIGDQLRKSDFRRLDLDFLRAYSRRINFYWNPRYSSMRGFSDNWMKAVAKSLTI